MKSYAPLHADSQQREKEEEADRRCSAELRQMCAQGQEISWDAFAEWFLPRLGFPQDSCSSWEPCKKTVLQTSCNDLLANQPWHIRDLDLRIGLLGWKTFRPYKKVAKMK